MCTPGLGPRQAPTPLPGLCLSTPTGSDPSGSLARENVDLRGGQPWLPETLLPSCSPSFPNRAWSDHRSDLRPAVRLHPCPRRVPGSVCWGPGPAMHPLCHRQAQGPVGRGSRGGDRRPPRGSRKGLAQAQPSLAPPRLPAHTRGGDPTHPALPGPGSSCWMWSHEATGKVSSVSKGPWEKGVWGQGGHRL